MPSKLPLKLDDLLRQRTVEGDRIEYKAGWNPDPILRTLCAFANDFENLGGGYVVIGQDCAADGQPIFPPAGLKANQVDKIQRELLGYCNLIQPPYFPILSVEIFEGRNLIVLWSPGGQTRPYQVPRSVTARTKEYHYYIRRYSSTVEAKGEDEQELLRLTATVPFDDRQCRQADVEYLRLSLIQSYLKELDLTEGRCTGIPTIRAAMAENGSPPPKFSTDDQRTHFLVELPVHPRMPGVVAAHDEAHHEAHDEAHDELTDTETRVLRFVEGQPKSRPEIADQLGLKSRSGHLYKAIDHLRNLGFIELTIPEKPQSKNQKMRITGKGQAWLMSKPAPEAAN